MILTINTDPFPKQYWPFGLCIIGTRCLLWGTNWILNIIHASNGEVTTTPDNRKTPHDINGFRVKRKQSCCTQSKDYSESPDQLTKQIIHSGCRPQWDLPTATNCRFVLDFSTEPNTLHNTTRGHHASTQSVGTTQHGRGRSLERDASHCFAASLFHWYRLYLSLGLWHAPPTQKEKAWSASR